MSIAATVLGILLVGSFALWGVTAWFRDGLRAQFFADYLLRYLVISVFAGGLVLVNEAALGEAHSVRWHLVLFATASLGVFALQVTFYTLGFVFGHRRRHSGIIRRG